MLKVTKLTLKRVYSNGEILNSYLYSATPGNQISDITPLTSLTNLANLRLDFNQISDVTPLTSLTNLMF
ncbi:hypothetical protein QUA82_17045 [Microcoleus sp. F8-D3]